MVLVAGALGAVALVVVVLLASAAGGSGGGYTVRAIFDDAANIISGEDVKIGGVKVGVVGSVTPTPQQKAAVVLKIEDPGFQDFREDASCTIEPEALIGEKFVNCLPTQPRAEGTPLPPPLHQIPAGHEGEGQYLLPATNTSSPIDVDLLEDINRLPIRQRFTIIINELGAGLASRGSDLNTVIRRADPALRELDKVLAILASQNKVLVNLADESNRALAPVAGVKEDISNFVVSADTVARASANQRGAIAQNLAAFPGFLRQFGPAMERFGRLAEQTIPTFTDLKAAAPGINQLFTNIAPFSRSSTTFFQSLGKSAKISGPALVALQPLLAKVKTLGTAAEPFSASLAELFTSLRDTGGLERILDFIFLGTGASNGYDSLGHFLRAEGIANICLTYAITPVSGCSAKLFSTSGSSAGAGSASGSSSSAGSSASAATAHSASAESTSASQSATAAKVEHAAGTSLLMARTLAVVEGATPAQAIAKFPGSVSTGETSSTPGLAGESSASAQPVGGSSSGTTYYTPSSEQSSGAGGMLLNYLLGGG
jgi:phospholipid/cholesterol/gamma-HCH transport system substrate-binding protein